MMEIKILKYNRKQVTEMIAEKYGQFQSVSISRDKNGLYYRISVPANENSLLEEIELDIVTSHEDITYQLRIKVFGETSDNMPIAY